MEIIEVDTDFELENISGTMKSLDIASPSIIEILLSFILDITSDLGRN